jgi:hypothetical protein
MIHSLIGDELKLDYPTTTDLRIYRSSPLSQRKLIVHSVRDLVSDPLTIDEFLRRPFILRSRYLIRGVDSVTGQHRQFYLGSSEQFRSAGVLRIGLYNPGETRAERLLARGFQPTLKDRAMLCALLREWRAMDFGDSTLRIFADDLRLVS